jgi:hypothetical protein
MNYNAGDIQEQLMRDGLPVKPDSVRTLKDGTWTAEYMRPLTDDEVNLASKSAASVEESKRIDAINAEANKRVATITGDQAQINQDIALAVGLMYSELRSQLSPATQAKLDPLAAKSVAANSIRQQALAMIADPNLTWD